MDGGQEADRRQGQTPCREACGKGAANERERRGRGRGREEREGEKSEREKDLFSLLFLILFVPAKGKREGEEGAGERNAHYARPVQRRSERRKKKKRQRSKGGASFCERE